MHTSTWYAEMVFEHYSAVSCSSQQRLQDGPQAWEVHYGCHLHLFKHQASISRMLQQTGLAPKLSTPMLSNAVGGMATVISGLTGIETSRSPNADVSIISAKSVIPPSKVKLSLRVAAELRTQAWRS